MPSRCPGFGRGTWHDPNAELFDFDWALLSDTWSEAWSEELKKRKDHNHLIKAQLLSGKVVCYRSSGDSLWPRVNDGDCCTYGPVESAEQVTECDIVFCQVDPDDRFVAHVVKKKERHPNRQELRFTIANIRGYDSGKCFIDTLYGRLISVHY